MAKKEGATDPTEGELQFIFPLFAEGKLSDDQIIGELESEGYTRRGKRLIKRLRMEYKVAQKVLKAYYSGLSTGNPEMIRHRRKLSTIARIILTGWLDSVKRLDDGKFELIDRENLTKPEYLDRKQLIEMLSSNLEYAEIQARENNLFECFKEHLREENKDIIDIESHAKQSPLELIDTLREIAERGLMKGTCHVCESL
jgi:hypothetical protein